MLDPTVDLTKHALTARDGYVLSRIDGHSTLSELADVIGIDEGQLVEQLERFERQGIIRWLGEHLPPAAPARKPDSVPSVANTVPIAPTEEQAPQPGEERSTDCELEPSELEAIHAMEQKLGASHWVVLGLCGDPSRSDVKTAFFGLSKRFHPDRYFGRELGEYESRISRIFNALKQSYDVLSNKKKRQAYESQNPAPPAPGSGGSGAGNPSAQQAPRVSTERDEDTERRLEERRRQIMAERKKRGAVSGLGLAPETRARADGFYQDGLTQLKAGDVLGAESSFKLALAHDPGNDAYDRAFADASQQASTLRARQRVSDAETKQEMGLTEEAAGCLAQASDLVPTHTGYALRAARAFYECNEIDLGWKYCDRALSTGTPRVEIYLLAAQFKLAAGDKQGARTYLEDARALEPDNPHVKKLIARAI